MAVRAIRAYRTVSGAAACALAGYAPWELEASILEQTYRCRAEAKARGERPTLDELVGVRRAAKTAVQAGWEEALRSARYGERTVQALLPVLADWRKRRHGSLTYRHVQPPYSPDVAPADFFLFPSIKSKLKGKHWGTIKDIQEATTRALKDLPVDVFQGAFRAWKTRLQKCIDAEGCYFEEY
ncbi:uncharacterized protein LOC113237938 [Hyposmocoma kahamanoa]|uniref:uncharacterized protein LOC113237938 n=1 Tax=Hyposmocoma kahamanoa TaxID=1477025 RepID=UPI000E6D5E7A|nr:uncharacterized protein LOC113237938 [Hyposmocoma kahamanoa]